MYYFFWIFPVINKKAPLSSNIYILYRSSFKTIRHLGPCFGQKNNIKILKKGRMGYFAPGLEQSNAKVISMQVLSRPIQTHKIVLTFFKN